MRKLPPTLTEQEFFRIPQIAQMKSNQKIKNLQFKFYSAEMVGETAAPPSSMAMVSFSCNHLTYTRLTNDLAKIKFNKPNVGSQVEYNHQIEQAPCFDLLVKPSPNQNHPQRPPPPIDNDPEFINFCKEFDSKFKLPTDQLIKPEKLNESDTVDSKKVIQSLSAKLHSRIDERSGGASKKGKRNKKRDKM